MRKGTWHGNEVAIKLLSMPKMDIEAYNKIVKELIGEVRD